jgi:CO dehydrogenase/acetyl-CoA synthase alpha subunit
MADKRCPRCEQTLPRSAFSLRANGYSHSVCKECAVRDVRAWERANPERAAIIRRATVLRRYYGITIAQYEHILAAQCGLCAICSTPAAAAPRGVLHVDHCARTARIRGLLCSLCNTAIGSLKHSPEIVRAAEKYLSKSLDGPGLAVKPGMPSGHFRGGKPIIHGSLL